MGRINFEEHLREKLDGRTLQPSANAWERLSSRLDQEKPRNTKSGIWWISVAASIVGAFFVASIFMDDKSVSTELVEESIEENSIRLNEVPAVLEEFETNQIAETGDVDAVKTQPSVQKEAGTLKKDRGHVVSLVNSSPSEGLAKQEVSPPLKENDQKAIIQESHDFISLKVEEVVAEVQTRTNNHQTITGDEIEALLAKAQRDIANQRILNNQVQKIDAAALLLDVETELEQSFRERVFNALGEGFNKVRTAVAERNN